MGKKRPGLLLCILTVFRRSQGGLCQSTLGVKDPKEKERKHVDPDVS